MIPLFLWILYQLYQLFTDDNLHLNTNTGDQLYTRELNYLFTTIWYNTKLLYFLCGYPTMTQLQCIASIPPLLDNFNAMIWQEGREAPLFYRCSWVLYCCHVTTSILLFTKYVTLEFFSSLSNHAKYLILENSRFFHEAWQLLSLAISKIF